MGYAPGLVETLTIRSCLTCTAPLSGRSPNVWTFEAPTGAKLVNSPLPPDTPPGGCGVPSVEPPDEEPPPTIIVTRWAPTLPVFSTVIVKVNCSPGWRGSTLVA